MPGARLEHLWHALQELGEGNERPCDRKPQITGGGPAGSSGDEADESSHICQSEHERERDAQVELERDVEQEVVDQVDG